MATGFKYLKFRCTGCGNCCKDPLLPLTDRDVRRIARSTGHAPSEMIRWVDRQGIDMDDEPEAFVMLRQGRRVMTLKHEHGRCKYLGKDDRCTIYGRRPIGCRVFPFDPSFGKRDGALKRLTLIQATECQYALDGQNKVDDLRRLHTRYDSETASYHAKVAEWNRVQRRRRRHGKSVQTAREFLDYLGLGAPPLASRFGAKAQDDVTP